MNGMEMARLFYDTAGRGLLGKFHTHRDRIAVGLVGEGSECFGYDDEISRDHDWGPGFCLWLTDTDYAEIGQELKAAYDALDPSSTGYSRRNYTSEGAGRVGVLSISDFYRSFTGLARAPESLAEWRRIPEQYLATATNGQVFYDPLGRFSDIREALLNFYPEDVRLKKIAARAAIMAQSGQYNFPRCVRREEWVAASMAMAEFVSKACSIIYLLNRRYTPFYKWMHRGIYDLPILHECSDLLLALCDNRHFGDTSRPLAYVKLEDTIELICEYIRKELQRQGISGQNSTFLLDHCPEILSHIEDEGLRNSHVMLD